MKFKYFFVLFFIFSTFLFAEDFYFQNKDENFIEKVNQSLFEYVSEKKMNEIRFSDLYPTIGCLSQIFKENSKLKKQYLMKDSIPTMVKYVYAISLLKGGMKKEALNYAKSFLGKKGIAKLKKFKNIEKVIPKEPSENDMLIGAYQVSGNEKFILNILSGYRETKDLDFLKDCVRLALLTNNYGNDMSPKGHKSLIVKSLFSKYDYKNDYEKTNKIMAMSSGLWAILSLSKYHEEVKDILEKFTKKNKTFKNILLKEKNNLANYLTNVILVDVLHKDKAVSKNDTTNVSDIFVYEYENLMNVDIDKCFKRIKNNK